MKKIFILLVLSCCSFMSAIAQSDNKIDLIKRDEGALNTRTANGMDYYTGKDYVEASTITYVLTDENDETYHRHVMFLINQDSENTVKLSQQTFKGIPEDDRPRLHTDRSKLRNIIESNIPKTQLADLKKYCHDFIGINIYVDPETGKVIYVNYALYLNGNRKLALSLPPQIYENIGNEIKNTFNYKDQITDEYKKYPVLRYAYTYIVSSKD